MADKDIRPIVQPSANHPSGESNDDFTMAAQIAKAKERTATAPPAAPAAERAPRRTRRTRDRQEGTQASSEPATGDQQPPAAEAAPDAGAKSETPKGSEA